MNVYDFEAARIDGTVQPLSDFRGQVLLIVNTATRCGLTPQLEGLENLYAKYRDRGFAVLGFPCNQFMRQSPESDEEIGTFCRVKYGTTFPTFAKIDVNGRNAHPLFKHLKKETGPWPFNAVKWNFTKFLVDREGRVVRRFAPSTKPEEIGPYIERLL
jgi:glutathione peroxidase